MLSDELRQHAHVWHDILCPQTQQCYDFAKQLPAFHVLLQVVLWLHALHQEALHNDDNRQHFAGETIVDLIFSPDTRSVEPVWLRLAKFLGKNKLLCENLERQRI